MGFGAINGVCKHLRSSFVLEVLGIAQCIFERPKKRALKALFFSKKYVI